MLLGFITNNLAVAGMGKLEDIGCWAAENGFQDLELGPSIPLEVDSVRAVMEKTGIRPSGLIYCRNVLDESEGEQNIQALKARIDFAAEIGACRITCSTGINHKAFVEGNPLRYDPEACMEDIVKVYTPLLEQAAKKGISLCFEMCPMMYNAAISPYMWERLFERLDAPHVGMVFDPSHLVWEMMDPYEAIQHLGAKIFHVHAKDCVIDEEQLKQTGILQLAHSVAEQVNTGEGVHSYQHTWWHYRLPGLGRLDWKRIITMLKGQGYNGTISIEHEDPVYSGSLEMVQKGIIMAQKHIQQYL